MDDSAFIGIEIASGRKPFILAVLDGALELSSLSRMDLKTLSSVLNDTPEAIVAVNAVTNRSGKTRHAELLRAFSKPGYKPYSKRGVPRQWIETNAGEIYHSLMVEKLLSRRALEGRIQRGLILYENGLRIADPMDFFEEITRHHMTRGDFPTKLLYSASELDALAAAYAAWMTVNRPE